MGSLLEQKIAAEDFADKDVSSIEENMVVGRAEWLKARFDSAAKEVITPKMNGLIDALLSEEAAGQIGAAPLMEGSEATVAGQMAFLKEELNGVSLGQIPSGSLTDDKLSDAPGQLKDSVAGKLDKTQLATAEENGVMSSADKRKLDALDGANLLINGEFAVWQRGELHNTTDGIWHRQVHGGSVAGLGERGQHGRKHHRDQGGRRHAHRSGRGRVCDVSLRGSGGEEAVGQNRDAVPERGRRGEQRRTELSDDRDSKRDAAGVWDDQLDQAGTGRRGDAVCAKGIWRGAAGLHAVLPGDGEHLFAGIYHGGGSELLVCAAGAPADNADAGRKCERYDGASGGPRCDL